ncbi:hypothetical protein [Streptomyces lydicus]|uniref:hypothetical protein n=1 Tax=Streptomyces lydicus TaxID=47763 RepID=UPI0010138690|nr:hypothetical protein [Streptomyces lydicus]MCZ1012031.1 hypothetical protein [Streptomyces lydicus]
MTLAELRARLAKLNHLPGHAEVLLADAEGNEYSPLHDIDCAMYHPESPTSGQLYPTPQQQPADCPHTPANAVPALILWPV